jgi:hypothetical protein
MVDEAIRDRLAEKVFVSRIPELINFRALASIAARRAGGMSPAVIRVSGSANVARSPSVGTVSTGV